MKKKQLIFTMMLLFLGRIGFTQDTTAFTKQLPLSQFHDQHSVFSLRNEQLLNKNKFLRFYVLSGYREGIQPISETFGLNFKAQIDTINGTHRIKMYNLSIQDMLTYGLRKPERVILEVKDPSKYRYDTKYGSQKEWLRKNAYCYELMMPIGVITSMKIVNDELSRLFKVKCSRQRRTIKTLKNIEGVFTEQTEEVDMFVITELN